MQWLAIHQPEIQLFVGVVFHSCQGVVDRSKDPTEGDVIRGERKYVVMETLVVQEIHGVVHGGGNVEGGRDDVVGMRFEGV